MMNVEQANVNSAPPLDNQIVLRNEWGAIRTSQEIDDGITIGTVKSLITRTRTWEYQL